MNSLLRLRFRLRFNYLSNAIPKNVQCVNLSDLSFPRNDAQAAKPQRENFLWQQHCESLPSSLVSKNPDYGTRVKESKDNEEEDRWKVHSIVLLWIRIRLVCLAVVCLAEVHMFSSGII
jgi:hypothetical protein